MSIVEAVSSACAVEVADLAEAPLPGSTEERNRFAELQERLSPWFARTFPDRNAMQTVVVVPGLSLDRGELGKLTGASYYEERLLCLLLLLRLPRTNLVYVTSEPVAPAIVDYYLHLLPDVPASHARRRLTLLSCDDSSNVALTEKILARPLLLNRIRAAVADPWAAHLTCFNATALERTLAVRLGIPLYACDPDLAGFGTKSGSRELIRRAGVSLPDGFERLRDMEDVVHALAALKQRQPALSKAVIKLEDGFSGEGNATFSYRGAPSTGLVRWIRDVLPRLAKPVAEGESWDRYLEKFGQMGGIVESFLSGERACSPSVQCRITPAGRAGIISTHDQILGGDSGQVYLGCSFPAAPAYAAQLHAPGQRIAELLASEGVIGRFGVDFVSVCRDGAWESSAIEINLRKGGTTHPFLMLQFLTDGRYDAETASYESATGQPCFYHATDNLRDASYVGWAPADVIDLAVEHDVSFNAATQEGVTFHLLGALPEYGKLGMVAIGKTAARARRFFNEASLVLQRECRGFPVPVRGTSPMV